MSRTGIVAVLCALLWISSACNTQEIGFERDGRDYIESIRQQYEVNPGGSLTVDAETGTIHISSSNNNEVDVLVRKRLRTTDEDRVRKEFRNIEVAIRQTYDGVRIEVERIDDNLPRWFWQDRTGVEIEVTVPVEFNLDLSTISDDIQTGKTEGTVTAKTLSGNISTGPTEGDLSIETTSGHIKARRVVGKVRANTLSGNIEIGPVHGDATLSSTSGKIETDIVEEDLNAETLSGNIEIGPVHGDATLSSTSGKIETDIVEEDLNAETLSGNIEIGPVHGDATLSSTSGDIRTGSVRGKLKTTTLSGNISFK